MVKRKIQNSPPNYNFNAFLVEIFFGELLKKETGFDLNIRQLRFRFCGVLPWKEARGKLRFDPEERKRSKSCSPTYDYHQRE
ncbi:hypothetical protein C1H46_006178 [Malus baccata]|uniref:Uncharacterized protein n=1 Tax=Malus baccata TaxID=106549 RepID=A0A540NAY8_MALBA|nr:hypothetical protein C1H46_006178 [Malus baccata]